MSAGAHITRVACDFSSDELATLAATLAGSNPADVCEVIGVVILHAPDGRHELKMIATADSTEQRLADVLRHAAAHVLGQCERCRVAAGNGGHGG